MVVDAQARSPHGDDDSRRRRQRPDLGLHLPVGGSTSGVAEGSDSEKVGRLILEVKGDFCAQVRGILRQHGREADYVEIGLDSVYCYNPLHNELEPYVLAYSIPTLLNTLYGRGKEPFCQQAYTYREVRKLAAESGRRRHRLVGGVSIRRR